MPKSKKVTIYTQVYKTEPYLKQCIESVLSQTYTNFEYILVDNASPDRCGEIIDRYAAQDKRIKAIHLTKNQGIRDLLVRQYGTGEYYSTIDSDDWWESDYLERLVHFSEENDLDIAMTGTVTYIEQDGSERVLRKLNEPLVLSRQQFAEYYPQLWTFPSTYWGSIMKMELVLCWDFEYIRKLNIPYGSDTVNMLKYLELCNRIGIDNSALYHYRIHPKGISYQYNSRRFDSNVAYYEAIRDFLEQHNTLDAEKQAWLKRVHITSMQATLNLLYESSISIQEKLDECVRIIEHPLTAYVLTVDCDEQKQWYHLMRAIISQTVGGAAAETEEKQLRQILQFIAPACAEAFSPEYIGLYAAESSFWTAMLMDDHETAVSAIMDWIDQRKYTKQFDLGKLLNRLIPDGFLLKDECDTRFFRTYAESCRLILKNDFDSALEEMTGILLENDTLYAEDRFLKLYLSIAALQNQIPAFLYGNIRLAYLCFNEGRYDECSSVLNDLDEMGAGEQDEILELRRALENVQ